VLGRLARLRRDPIEYRNRAALLEDRTKRIAVADRSAAGRDDHVGDQSAAAQRRLLT
jgi:hypothetical protein